MEIAAVHAIARLAQEETNDEVAMAYGVSNLSFGPECIIPKPFDPRLMLRIAPAVAQAAMRSGVATRPLADLDAYQAQLQQFVYHSGTFMKPLFAVAKKAHAAGGASRVVFAEGEDERVLRAVQVVVDEGIAPPDPDRPAGGDRAAPGALRPAHARRRRPGRRQSGIGPALPALLAEPITA